jgi:hypothetical protein
MNIFETFRDKWIKEELDVHPPKDKSAIIKCFSAFGFIPTADLLELYGALDGKDCMDDEYFRLWSLNEILEENSSEDSLTKAKQYGVLFADHCISCWCYRINSRGEVFVDYFTEEKEPEIRAESLTEFFELKEKSPDAIL